jgi:hypothetical protein
MGLGVEKGTEEHAIEVRLGMPLRNDIFLHQGEAVPASRAPLGELKDALAGIGDRKLRAAQDFLWAMNPQTSGGWRPALGDEVEFDLPRGDGLIKSGRVHELQSRDAIVQVGVGEYNIVPLDRLRPLRAELRRQERRQKIAEALVGGGGGPWALHETRALLPVGSSGKEFAATIEYKAGFSPTEDDVLAFLATRYPGARVVDGDDTHPGKLAVILAFADETTAKQAFDLSRGAQLSGPADPPSSRERQPSTEMIDGTGLDVDPVKRAAEEQLEAVANLNPEFTFVATSIERVGEHAFAHFELWRDGAPLFVREGRLTPVLAEDASPAIGSVCVGDGHLHVAGGTMALGAFGIKMAEVSKDQPYAAGQGPLSMHENEPNAAESGSYIVKADAGPGNVEGAPPPISQLTERDYQRVKEQTSPVEDATKAKKRRQEQQKTRPLTPLQPWMEASVAPATEEDGEHRETIGGPGLHVAVDEEAKDYWEGYFGDYGEKLTEDVPRRAEARLEMIRQAWFEACKSEPTADEALWVLGVLATGRQHQAKLAQTQPPIGGAQFEQAPGLGVSEEPAATTVETPAAPPAATVTPPAATVTPPAATVTPPAAVDYTALANALIKTMNIDERASAAVDLVMTKFLAKVPTRQRTQIDQRDPATLQRVLPLALQQAAPNVINQLTRQFAPQMGGQQGKWYDPRTRSRERTRREVERGLRVQETLGGSPTTVPSAPAATQPAATQPAATQPAATQPAATKPFGDLSKLSDDDLRGQLTNLLNEQQRRQERKIREQGRPSATAGMRLADTASDAYPGRRPDVKGNLHFRTTGLRRDGDYICMTVVWDVDAADQYAPADFAHQLKTYAQQRAGEKEFIDLGYIGKPNVVSMDPDVGLAEVRFRSSNSVGIAPEFIEREDGAYHEPVR